jgi:hypothetical protein
VIFLPVGIAADAPQKAKAPSCSFTILPALRSSIVSGFVLVLQLNIRVAATVIKAIKISFFIIVFFVYVVNGFIYHHKKSRPIRSAFLIFYIIS